MFEIEDERDLYHTSSSLSRLISRVLLGSSGSGVEERDESDEDESSRSPLVNPGSNEESLL
jgi:hypothetical protein